MNVRTSGHTRQREAELAPHVLVATTCRSEPCASDAIEVDARLPRPVREVRDTLSADGSVGFRIGAPL